MAQTTKNIPLEAEGKLIYALLESVGWGSVSGIQGKYLFTNHGMDIIF